MLIMSLRYSESMVGPEGRYRPSFSPQQSLKLHYQLMPAELKEAYRLIEEAVEKHRDEVAIADPSGDILNQLDRVIEVIHLDYPRLFWLHDSSYVFDGDAVTVRFYYHMTEAECNRMLASMEGVAKGLFDSRIHNCKSEYEVEMAVHDYIASTVVYLDDSERQAEMHTALGPLVLKKGVCEGISLAVAYLLNCYGVRCGTIGGNIIGGGPHAWNIVLLENEAYHLDVTWDLQQTNFRDNHAFFNVNDAEMRRSRTWNLKLKCDSTRLNYHQVNGVAFSTLAEAECYIGKRHLVLPKKIDLRIEEQVTVDQVLAAAKRALGRSLHWPLQKIECSYVPNTGVFQLVFPH